MIHKGQTVTVKAGSLTKDPADTRLIRATVHHINKAQQAYVVPIALPAAYISIAELEAGESVKATSSSAGQKAKADTIIYTHPSKDNYKCNKTQGI